MDTVVATAWPLLGHLNLPELEEFIWAVRHVERACKAGGNCCSCSTIFRLWVPFAKAGRLHARLTVHVASFLAEHFVLTYWGFLNGFRLHSFRLMDTVGGPMMFLPTSPTARIGAACMRLASFDKMRRRPGNSPPTFLKYY